MPFFFLQSYRLQAFWIYLICQKQGEILRFLAVFLNISLKMTASLKHDFHHVYLKIESQVHLQTLGYCYKAPFKEFQKYVGSFHLLDLELNVIIIIY